MPVNPEDYNSDAISGEKLRALMQDEVYDRLKGDVPESIAVFLCSLKAQVDSIQKAMAEQNLGERTADSLDSQSLKVGGTDVKTKQTAKDNPSASSGSANTFVDTIKQNENGELTATRRVMKMYTGTGSNTDAPMTQKAASDAIALKANIASPTFTGTPAAPTASGSTDTTQIATTAFVHDAIENDLKKAADVSGMGNDDTHAYSGEAVSMAISSAVSGNVGGFLGNMTVAQMNSYTNPKMGDNAIVTDTGTITVGSESCVITTAPSEVRWTTSGSWKVSSAGYVRDTQVATTSVLGLVKLNTSNGGVELNSNNQMVVHGWSTKQDSLPYANGKYGIDISGSASSASAAESGSALAQAIAPDADVALILYGDSTYTNVKALYNAGKKLYLVTGGNIQPSGRFEYRIPLTLITYDANLEVNAFYFEQTQDDRAGASEVGSIAVYRLDSTGWTTTPKQVGYAVNAGHSSTSDTATNATNDHGGAKIRDAYVSNVVESVYDSTNPPQYIYSFGGVSVAANQDGFRVATLSSYKIPFPRVYFHTRSELTVRNPTDPSSTTPDNCAYIINNSLASLGYNGFTCLGHEKPIGYGQKYYGVCSTDLIGGLTEIDFDFSATWVNHIMEQQNFPPSFMQIVFAATWDDNDFRQYPNCGYGFALNHENIFTTTRGSYRFEYGTSGFNNDMPVMGHVRMVGVIGNAGLRRLFIGAFQPRSDAYIKMKISNVRVRGNLGAKEASVM